MEPCEWQPPFLQNKQNTRRATEYCFVFKTHEGLTHIKNKKKWNKSSNRYVFTLSDVPMNRQQKWDFSSKTKETHISEASTIFMPFKPAKRALYDKRPSNALWEISVAIVGKSNSTSF